MRLTRVNREILALTIPSVITNITTPLLALLDVTIAGHMGDAVYIAAIAVGGSMFNMLYWLFGFLRMGTSGMTAQAYGAEDTRRQIVVLLQALLVAVSVSGIMLVSQHTVCSGVLRFMDVEGNAATLAAKYFKILIWGAPAYLGTFALTGWFLGMQTSRIPMWVSIFTNLCNVGVSVTLVYVFDMGIAGIATGTLCAQWCGFALALAMCVKRCPKGVDVNWRDVVDLTGLRRFFSVNTDIFLRTVCLVAVTMWFTRVGALQGDVMLAVNALLMQFFTLFSFFMDGFAFSGEALVGRYIGARDASMLHSTVKALVGWGVGIAVLFTLFYFAGGDVMLRLLSDDCSVVERADDFMPWVITIPAFGFLAFTWDGIFIGATATRDMLLSMFAATTVFFMVDIIAFPHMGNHGLWLAFVSYMFTRGFVLSMIGRRYLRMSF